MDYLKYILLALEEAGERGIDFSRLIYEDLEALRQKELIDECGKNTFRLTKKGLFTAESLRKKLLQPEP